MKFNGADLGHISAQWGSTFEGILLLKQKSESFFKRSTSFCEYWCRLKGNLLVVLRNEGTHSKDLVGVVLLERCRAITVVDAEVQNAFEINFECGDPPMLFAARSAEEAVMWCNHISKAGLSELSARRLQLREEIRHITGKDPLDPLNPALNAPQPPFDPDELNEAGLELQLSLPDENASFDRNPDLGLQVLVFVKQPDHNNSWDLIAETEVQTKDCPTFLKTIKLNSERMTKSSLIMFKLFEFKDIRSSVCRAISSVETTAETLYNTSTLNLHLNVDSDTSSKASGSERVLVVQVLNRSSSVPDFDHLDPNSQQLRNVCENILTRNYVFPHTLGENMRVVEFMGESRINFQFPIEYVKSLITQEHLLYDSLLRVGMSDPTLECLRRERLMGMKNVIERYEICLRSTVDHVGPSFKRSTERTCAELDFVPTNLHVNRIGLLDSDNKLISFHDIISVGAFSSSSIKFKTKGLFQTLATFSDPDSASGNNNPHHSASLMEMLQNSPTGRVLASSALQYDNDSIGRAFRQLCTGGVVVVHMGGDLTELNSRLGPSGQAGILAQRLERGMAAFVEICKSASANTTCLQELRSNYEPLIKCVADLATLDAMAEANQSDSVHRSKREAALQKIASASSRLHKLLSRTWEQVEEALWHKVLTNLAAAATSCESSSSAGVNLHAVSSVWDSVHYRHHTALCQALTTTLTGLAVAVSHWKPSDWKQMVRCGVPLHFEGLLSCYGEEICMLENWAWAIQSLAFCRVVVRPNASAVPLKSDADKIADLNESERAGNDRSNPLVQILGHNEILLKIPRTAWDRVPTEVQARGRIVLSLHPFHFNVGINEQQTFAERLERVNLQASINTNGYTSLKNYFDKYTRKFGAPKKTSTQQDVCDVLRSLEYVLVSGKSKPVEILRLVTEISSSLNALRFTSCKSAKDRTSMAVSLEQIRWLTDVEGMHKNSFSPALKCLRSTGLRLSNVEKNINKRKYSFTRFQLLSFPKAYRPPVGTYSLHVQS